MTITLVIPVYNEAPFLERCLDSIAKQSEAPDEIIIIDDCSTDKSARIATRYCFTNNWRLIVNEENYGVSYSRNYGIDHATSDYITFIDADDELTPNAIATMKRYAQTCENIVQFNHLRKYRGVEMLYNKYKEQTGIHTLATMPDAPKAWFAAWNKIYKRDFLDDHNLRFDDELRWGEDELFNLRAIIENGCIRCQREETLIRHFDNPHSLNRSRTTSDMARQLAKIQEMATQYDGRKRNIIEQMVAQRRQMLREVL